MWLLIIHARRTKHSSSDQENFFYTYYAPFQGNFCTVYYPHHHHHRTSQTHGFQLLWNNLFFSSLKKLEKSVSKRKKESTNESEIYRFHMHQNISHIHVQHLLNFFYKKMLTRICTHTHTSIHLFNFFYMSQLYFSKQEKIGTCYIPFFSFFPSLKISFFKNKMIKGA